VFHSFAPNNSGRIPPSCILRSASSHSSTTNPQKRSPANNLAWLLATHPDPDIREPLAAIEVAEGLRRDGERLGSDQLDTLAAAYAAAGRFPEAGLTASAAAQLARNTGRPELAREIEARLRLYRAQRPFIDTHVRPGL